MDVFVRKANWLLTLAVFVFVSAVIVGTMG